ncbi:hypothetical protein SeMB42_g06290 [Synchytrium endobioticum]|uniref:Uncharacterized protein n=1 Tax=Synchytrium endobioticum TaxID=286115 RepID=A0A507CWA8_9FUNG|nr:hypothetical protein SeMB42_g06290 [Synchytrium endobioticum]TPX43479.1 hypothetical protein SeLEV6574_g05040 [Synchytrium endobioticum]
MKQRSSIAHRGSKRPTARKPLPVFKSRPTLPRVSTPSTHTKVKKQSKTKHTIKSDVYEADDHARDESRILGINSRGNRLDDVETYELDEDAEIASDDDDEVTEDEAFDEGDEAKYSDFFAPGRSYYIPPAATKRRSTSRKQGIKYKPLDLNEDEEKQDSGPASGSEAEDDDGSDKGSDVMQLSDMLNDDAETRNNSINRKSNERQTSGIPTPNISELLPNKDEDVADESSEGQDEQDSDQDIDKVSEEDEEATANLMSFVSSLAPKRAAASTEGGEVRKKRKRNIKVVTEPYEESEFNLRTPSYIKTTQLELSDLLAPLKDTTEFGSLKRKIAEFDTDRKYSQPFAAPLPKRQQDQQIRQAAYSEAKKEVSKWQSFVKANQQADSLSFPMNETAPPVLTNNLLSASFEPGKNDLERDVQEILEASGLSERKLQEHEELQMGTVSTEEMIKRREELAKMRALLFFHEQKQKKIAKIKSKTYRKIRKKENLKRAGAQDLDVNELMKLDPELARQKAAEQQLTRIKERMSLRHKNSGKWARAMLGRRDAGSETRQALMDQLQQHDALKRKMSGLDSDESSDEDDENDNDQTLDDEANDAKVKTLALESLSNLADEIRDESSIPLKGVFGMKFMQNALKRQQAEAAGDVDDAIKEMQWEEDYRKKTDNGELCADEDKREKDGVAVCGNSGRTLYGQNINRRQDEKPSADDSDDDGGTDVKCDGMQLGRGGLALKAPGFSARVSGSISIPIPNRSSNIAVESVQKPIFEVEAFTEEVSVPSLPVTLTAQTIALSKVDIPDPADTILIDKRPPTQIVPAPSEPIPLTGNPWLTVSAAPTEKSTKIQSAPKSKQEKALSKLSSARKALDKTVDEDVVRIDLKGVASMQADGSQVSMAGVQKSEKSADVTDSRNVHKQNGNQADVAGQVADDDGIAPENAMVHSTDVSQLSSRDIMQMAFADDHVVDEFEEEKRLVQEQDAPKEEDLTLPGWGSWGGVGIKPKKNVVVRKPKPHEGIDIGKRKDAKLHHVIINEKRIKKAAKYMLAQVPHNFDNAEQYEHTIRMPLGSEWNSPAVHQSSILPKIRTKQGAVIEPPKLPKKFSK